MMQQALEQRSNATALEGYVGMESETVAPSTLPATIMLPVRAAGSPQNIVVSTAVSASHVAFSAVRLEPTWMMLGSAAGMIATLAIQRGAEISLQRKDNRRTTNDFSNSGLVDLERVTAFSNPQLEIVACSIGNVEVPRKRNICVEQVRTVDLQRRIIAHGQPIVYFSDMLVGDPGWKDLQLIAPHAFDATDGFAARPHDSLSRAMVVRLTVRHMFNFEIHCCVAERSKTDGNGQVQWIGAALQAANSTLGVPGRPGALLPVPSTAKEWPDYHPGDPGFKTAAALAAVGAATPAPGLGEPFLPRQCVSTADVQLWVRSAAWLLPTLSATPAGANDDGIASGSSDGGKTTNATRSQAATIIVGALLGGPILAP